MPTRPPGTPDPDITDLNTVGVINDAIFVTGSLQPAGSRKRPLLRPDPRQLK